MDCADPQRAGCWGEVLTFEYLSPLIREMTVARGVTQSRYFMLTHVFSALSVERGTTEPGRLFSPLGEPEGYKPARRAGRRPGMEGPSGTGMEGLLAAGRDRCSFQVRGQSKSALAVLLRVGHVCGGATASLCQACPGAVSPRRVAMKVAFPGGSSVPEGQVPLSLSTSAPALPLEQGSIGKHLPHLPQFPQNPHFHQLRVRHVDVCSVPWGERNAWNRWNRCRPTGSRSWRRCGRSRRTGVLCEALPGLFPCRRRSAPWWYIRRQTDRPWLS